MSATRARWSRGFRDVHAAFAVLEVLTDAPQPSIIFPSISQAFPFPQSHSLNDRPYSTPSSSSFELLPCPSSASCTMPPLTTWSCPLLFFL
ncbi:hypothetical protein K435DRAFT_880977 [Dendrothele bispora CBS 962.96]|uniref:Uncharacterized protein n=1 Tax=Dendrothele bispora (strain CBS 962.96) TaxID=1314807 RepID=A0A4S8KJT6_DENBC|nr:hypothetical protein K435DRAFT_880977 [Dendrothele bispora CBS 962.96]